MASPGSRSCVVRPDLGRPDRSVQCGWKLYRGRAGKARADIDRVISRLAHVGLLHGLSFGGPVQTAMHFPDLSPYRYSGAGPFHDVLNVGWLDRAVPFESGLPSVLLAAGLREWFRIARINQFRGIHACNLCVEHEWPLPPLDSYPSIDVDGERRMLGNWEIWIPGALGKIYAAPALIIHYVEAHGYAPPSEFISAAMDDTAMTGWNAQAEFAKRSHRHD